MKRVSRITIETGERHLNWEHVEVPGLHREGHEFPLELSFGEYKKDDRHLFIGIARDVTARKKAEAQILEVGAEIFDSG